MIYRIPMVENKWIAESFAMISRPLGPIMMPEIINPIRPGKLNLFRTIGAKRIINRIKENISTGLDKGS